MDKELVKVKVGLVLTLLFLAILIGVILIAIGAPWWKIYGNGGLG